MIYLIVKNQYNKITARNIFEQIDEDGLDSIKKSILRVTSNYKTSTFTELNNHSVISLENESKYFKKDFIKKIEELLIDGDFTNLDIFNNYVMYIIEQGTKKHIAFKGFEDNIRIKRTSPRISFYRNPEIKEEVKVHFKSENDISLPIDWDFKYVIDNYEDKENKFYINQLTSINNFLLEPLEDIRIKNFKIFEEILKRNGYFFKTGMNGENKYKSYMKEIPLWRHPDIEKIISNIDYIISEQNKILLLELSLVENNTKELHITKIKHTIALLVDKIWKDKNNQWQAANTSEIIEITNYIEKEANKKQLELVVNNA